LAVKRKLTEMQKKIIRVQTKLRQIWDLVIQGNTSDLGSAISDSMKSIENTEKEFKRLIH
jgi:CHASE3 domain sensor protein